MEKSRSYSFYIILGLPVSITILLTNSYGWSGLFNVLNSFIMTLYCMNVYFRPDDKDISSLASSFFLSATFVLLSTFFLSLPLWLIVLGFR